MEIVLLYLNDLFLLPQIAQVYIYNQVKAYQKEAQKLLDLLGEMEVAISLLRHKRDLEVVCQPVFTETGWGLKVRRSIICLSNPIAK